MAETIVNQNNTISQLTNTNADLNQIMTKLQETNLKSENDIETLKKKIIELEGQLEYEKKLRLGDFDSSNSPPLVKK
jgi:predicted nuclease with TOPRIM domain